MKEKPFWAYELDEIMTPKLSEEIAHAIFRAWTGEEPPVKRDSAGREHDEAVAGDCAV